MRSEKLRQVLSDHSDWLQSDGKRGTRANLAGAWLWRANFEGADLRKAILQRVNLRRANLSEAPRQGHVPRTPRPQDREDA